MSHDLQARATVAAEDGATLAAEVEIAESETAAEIGAIAGAVIDGTDGEIDAAARQLVAACDDARLAAYLKFCGAKAMIERELYTRRTMILRNVERGAWTIPVGPERTARAAAETIRTIYDFPLPGGLAIGNASRQELEEAQAYYERHARSYANRARMMAAIAAAMPANGRKTVRKVLSEARLAELMKEHGGDEE